MVAVEPARESFSPAEYHKDVVWYRSCRVTMVMVSAWGFVFFYLLRINLSMAIVCMVRDPRGPATNLSFSGQDNQSLYADVTLAESSRGGFGTSGVGAEWMMTSQAPRRGENGSVGVAGDCGLTLAGKTAAPYTGELEWSKEMRGYVLSSFFYGYVITQVPGGWLAARYGGKPVFGYGVLLTVVATVLVPVAARTHVYLMIALRAIMGLGCGVGFPATHHLYGQWIPPLERSRLVTFCHAGTFIGTIIALFASGFLCDSEIDNGWPLIFYIYGGLTFVWWIFWHFFVFNSPVEHPRIDPVERDYIRASLGLSKKPETERQEAIPWVAILRSPPVWAIITSHSCNNWATYTILVCIPTYMKEVLKFDAKQNGALSALPYVLGYFGAVGAGALSDWLIVRKYLSITKTRKCSQCISSAVPAVLMVLMGYLECEQRYLAVALLCLTLVVISGSRAGYTINHLDLSSRHAGLLFGISNTVATVPGMLAPTVVALLTPNGSREEWLKVFYICSGLYVFSTIFFAVFGSGVEQPWAKRRQVADVSGVQVSRF